MNTSFETFKVSALPFTVLLISVLLLSSCAGPSLTESRKGNTSQIIKINDVLLLSLIRHTEKRKMMENALARVLSEEKVEALQSYKISEKMIEENKDAVIELVQKADAESIMIITIGNVKEKSFAQSSLSMPQVDDTTRIDSYFETRGSQTVVTSTMANLEVHIFDIKTEELLWSAIVKVNNPKSTGKYFNEVAREIVQGLKKDGVI
jgi:hypothetical protein